MMKDLSLDLITRRPFLLISSILPNRTKWLMIKMMNKVKVMKAVVVKPIWVGYLTRSRNRAGVVFMVAKFRVFRNSRIYYRLRTRKRKCLKIIGS